MLGRVARDVLGVGGGNGGEVVEGYKEAVEVAAV